MRRFLAIPLKLFSLSKLATLGAVITTSGFLLEALLLWWSHGSEHHNPYVGIFTWNVIPGGIATGLALIPAGLLLAARKLGGGKFDLAMVRRAAETADWTLARHVGGIVGGLTLVNGAFFLTAGYEGYHYMDQPSFCGLVCHQVMEPEYRAYQDSPHSGVACVACHIGSGVTPFVKAKLNGSKQMLGVMTGDYSRPIETPVHQLRSGDEICEACHDPRQIGGNRIKVIERYQEDEQSTLHYTILNMRIGPGDGGGHATQGIHSHVQPDREITYETLDEDWNQVVRITRTDEDGERRVWTRSSWDHFEEIEVVRTMDCVDCHNRVGHDFGRPGDVLDELLRSGRVSLAIPWIKHEALQALAAPYSSTEAAHAGIAGLAERYRTAHPEAWQTHQAAIEEAIAVLQETWSLHVWPEMKLEWGTYESRHTHGDTEAGCFRCHNDELVDETGQPLTSECEDCHYVLAEDDADPSVFECLHRVRSVDLF